MKKIIDILKKYEDKQYASFQTKLIPSEKEIPVIGVRTPALKKIAADLKDDPCVEKFFAELPHKYFDENQLHGFLISQIKDFDICIKELEKFLPFIDNWATCDQTSPKCFSKNKKALLPFIDKWIKSEHTYTVRFGIGMLMRHFLDEDFKQEYLEKVKSVRSGEYYVRMEVAWYMATALAKQWDASIPIIENHQLDDWTHKKTIQKACESFRVTEEHKKHLKELKSSSFII
ncbi:MAG: DNA alkylation repair protein [Treponema sp.]|nr:DNA alkylation repair protein [Treponema sp.]MBO6219560.1 DNA alkylation repair protein [Treponema sp.]